MLQRLTHLCHRKIRLEYTTRLLPNVETTMLKTVVRAYENSSDVMVANRLNRFEHTRVQRTNANKQLEIEHIRSVLFSTATAFQSDP